MKDMGIAEAECTMLTDSETTCKTLQKQINQIYKHMSVYIEYVKDLVKHNIVQVHFIPRDQNIADNLTKQNPQAEFERQWGIATKYIRWKHVKGKIPETKDREKYGKE